MDFADCCVGGEAGYVDGCVLLWLGGRLSFLAWPGRLLFTDTFISQHSTSYSSRRSSVEENYSPLIQFVLHATAPPRRFENLTLGIHAALCRPRLGAPLQSEAIVSILHRIRTLCRRREQR